MATKTSKAAKRSTAKAPANGSGLKAIREKQTKSEIVRAIAEDTQLTRAQVGAVLASLGALAKRHVMRRGSGEFAIPDMGLKVRRVARKARTARNPMTGEQFRVPARSVVKASVLKTLKEVAA